jgi:hypothetical protein
LVGVRQVMAGDLFTDPDWAAINVKREEFERG